MTLEDHRRFYAEEIAAVAGLRSDRLINAFAEVRREDFLGPGPWQLASLDFSSGTGTTYRATPDDDPRRIYHNILVAIDPQRQLNNGHPSALASWIGALDIVPGDRVFHLGCGFGYYSAIMAEMAGSTGHVTAAEVDEKLAQRARDNLRDRVNVEVIAGDGGAIDPGQANAMLINAGVTHPNPLWLDRLRPGGRLLFPLTFDTGDGIGKGGMILVKRAEDGSYPVKAISFVMIFSCTSLRDPDLNKAILKCVSGGKMSSIQSLRRDAHEASETCLIHGGGFCLSTNPAAG